MRLLITKPRNGVVDVRLDDRRGLTRLNLRRHKVPVKDLEAVVEELTGLWEKRRADILRPV